MGSYKWENTETEILFNGLFDEMNGSKESYLIQKKKIDKIIELEPENTHIWFWTLACNNYNALGFFYDDDDIIEKAAKLGERAHYLHNQGHKLDAEELVILYSCMTESMLILGRKEDMEKYYSLRAKYESELSKLRDE